MYAHREGRGNPARNRFGHEYLTPKAESVRLSEALETALTADDGKILLNFSGVAVIDDVPKRYQGVRTLLLSQNRIASLERMVQFRDVVQCSLSFNGIADWAQLGFLRASTLQVLSLEGNPIAAHPDYRHRVISLFPRLRQLDGHAVTSDDRRDVHDAHTLQHVVLDFMLDQEDLRRDLRKLVYNPGQLSARDRQSLQDRIDLRRRTASIRIFGTDDDPLKPFVRRRIRPCVPLTFIRRFGPAYLEPAFTSKRSECELAAYGRQLLAEMRGYVRAPATRLFYDPAAGFRVWSGDPEFLSILYRLLMFQQADIETLVGEHEGQAGAAALREAMSEKLTLHGADGSGGGGRDDGGSGSQQTGGSGGDDGQDGDGGQRGSDSGAQDVDPRATPGGRPQTASLSGGERKMHISSGPIEAELRREIDLLRERQIDLAGSLASAEQERDRLRGERRVLGKQARTVVADPFEQRADGILRRTTLRRAWNAWKAYVAQRREDSDDKARIRAIEAAAMRAAESAANAASSAEKAARAAQAIDWDAVAALDPAGARRHAAYVDRADAALATFDSTVAETRARLDSASVSSGADNGQRRHARAMAAILVRRRQREMLRASLLRWHAAARCARAASVDNEGAVTHYEQSLRRRAFDIWRAAAQRRVTVRAVVRHIRAVHRPIIAARALARWREFARVQKHKRRLRAETAAATARMVDKVKRDAAASRSSTPPRAASPTTAPVDDVGTCSPGPPARRCTDDLHENGDRLVPQCRNVALRPKGHVDEHLATWSSRVRRKETRTFAVNPLHPLPTREILARKDALLRSRFLAVE